MTKKKGPVLLVELSGILSQWQKWEGDELLGLPVGHNIIQVMRWRAKYPHGRILVRVSPGKQNKRTLKVIRDWLVKNEVMFNDLSVKKELPEFDEHWKMGE